MILLEVKYINGVSLTSGTVNTGIEIAAKTVMKVCNKDSGSSLEARLIARIDETTNAISI